MHKVRKHGSGARFECEKCGKDIGGKLEMRKHMGRDREGVFGDLGVAAGFLEVGRLN